MKVPGAAGQRSRFTIGVGGNGLDLHAGALWVLVGLEALALLGLRHYFRRHHGG